MKKLVIIVIILITGLGVYGIATSKDSSPPQQQPQQQAKTFASIQSDVKLGAKLYDVRTAAEYKAGHFENAINFSLQDMQAGKLPDVAKDNKVYVYCQSGNRSAQAAAILKQAGFTNVIDLGGLQDVQSTGGKLIQ